MKILIVADNESKYIWDFFRPENFKDIDLVISCGDLKNSYLSFLATLIPAPLLYVHGNHDNRYLEDPPGGCDSIEDQIYVYKGLRILGLGGSYRYKEGPLQYSEKEMRRRIRKLKGTLKKHNGFDILVTHAPAFGVGDGDDLCHRGFESFNALIEEYKPSYFLHGHQHLNYNRNAKRIQKIDETTVINGFEYHILDYKPNIYAPKEPFVLKKKFQIFKKH